MPKIIKEIAFGEHKLVLETGEVARQADGAVMASMNGTQVLVTVVGKKDSEHTNDFFPLTVNYQEKFYAAGKIPGGYNKREGRPSEHETLTSRLMDRPIRPLFPKGYSNDVQIIATVLSHNREVSSDIVAMIGASAALSISGLPFQGPIAAARIGYHNGIYLLNPSEKELESSQLDLVVSGTKDAILMVESEAKELSEDIMRGAIIYGHEMMKSVIHLIEDLAKEVNKPAIEWIAPEKDTQLEERISQICKDELTDAYQIKDKQQRYERLSEIRKKVLTQFESESEEESISTAQITDVIDSLEKQIVRNRILEGEPRIDGRDHKSVRHITIQTPFLSRTHGSTLFTRGETQAIAVVTLGNERDAQSLDQLSGESKDRFMLHYNFPPYSVGETGMVGSPKRREIGHGRLAKRALLGVMPTSEEFPYVIRAVSEITESNGSSSMATVCGTSLALMDAGVPLKEPVAGVAMGLIKDNERFCVLTDILGDEDHLGDMDFKVAGTKNGITALQMDIKITGITEEIMKEALEQALEGRLHILDIMNNARSEHREELSKHAPRITTMKVAEDKVRTIIGKGGSTIKGLIDSTGVSIDIDDNGVVQLFSPDADALEEAQRQIKALVAEVEVGQTYKGKVTKIVDFGAFINLLPGKDGLLHISQICTDRSQKVDSILTEGQEIEAYVAGVDKQGRVKLEWKDKPQAEAEKKEVVTEQNKEESETTTKEVSESNSEEKSTQKEGKEN